MEYYNLKINYEILLIINCLIRTLKYIFKCLKIILSKIKLL